MPLNCFFKMRKPVPKCSLPEQSLQAVNHNHQKASNNHKLLPIILFLATYRLYRIVSFFKKNSPTKRLKLPSLTTFFLKWAHTAD